MVSLCCWFPAPNSGLMGFSGVFFPLGGVYGCPGVSWGRRRVRRKGKVLILARWRDPSQKLGLSLTADGVSCGCEDSGAQGTRRCRGREGETGPRLSRCLPRPTVPLMASRGSPCGQCWRRRIVHPGLCRVLWIKGVVDGISWGHGAPAESEGLKRARILLFFPLLGAQEALVALGW